MVDTNQPTLEPEDIRSEEVDVREQRVQADAGIAVRQTLSETVGSQAGHRTHRVQQMMFREQRLGGICTGENSNVMVGEELMRQSTNN